MRPVRTTSFLPTPPWPLKWLIALSLFSLLIIGLWLLVTLIQAEWLPQYPNSVRLPPCGHSGVAGGAQSPARDTDTFYLYTQICLVTNDSTTQVNAWYNQHGGWKNLAGTSGTYRSASVNLGVCVLHFQQTAYTLPKNGSTEIILGVVISGHETWP